MLFSDAPDAELLDLAVQARLEHASTVETLDTYAHRLPDSEDPTRQTIEAVLGASAASQIHVPLCPS